MTTWTAQAELLADTIREPGSAAAAITASAWRAGVHPEATHGLVGAAVALAGDEVLSSLWSASSACPDDKTLLAQAADLEGDVAELVRHAGRFAADCCAERASAISAWRAASAALNAATAAGDAGAAAAARDAMGAAGRVIADCDAALEIIAQVRDRLAYALKCLRQLPDDYASHYELPYEFRRHLGPLPVTGEFLTGSAA